MPQTKYHNAREPTNQAFFMRWKNDCNFILQQRINPSLHIDFYKCRLTEISRFLNLN